MLYVNGGDMCLHVCMFMCMCVGIYALVRVCIRSVSLLLLAAILSVLMTLCFARYSATPRGSPSAFPRIVPSCMYEQLSCMLRGRIPQRWVLLGHKLYCLSGDSAYRCYVSLLFFPLFISRTV